MHTHCSFVLKHWPFMSPWMLEMQNLRLHSKPPESESAFYQDSESIYVDMKSWEVCQQSLRTQATSVWHFSDHRNWLRSGYVFKEALVKEIWFCFCFPVESEEGTVPFSFCLLSSPGVILFWCSLSDWRRGKTEARASKERSAAGWSSHTWPPPSPWTSSVTGANMTPNWSTWTDYFLEP